MRPAIAVLLAGLVAAQDDAPPSFSVPATVSGRQNAPIAIPVTGVVPGPVAEYGQTVTVAAYLGEPVGSSLPVTIQVARTSPAGTYPATWTVTLTPLTWGTFPLLVVADDGATPIAQRVSVAIQHVNRAPSLYAAPLPVADGGTALVGPDQLLIFDDDLLIPGATPVADVPSYLLDEPPVQGDLLLAGAVLAAGAAFTQADVDAGRLAYRHRLGGGDDLFSVRFTDGIIAAPLGPREVPVQVAAVVPPQVLPAAVNVSWREGDAPVALLPAALLADGDAPLSAGSQVNAVILLNPAAADALTVIATDDIAVADGRVLYRGDDIGGWSGGSGGATLVIALAGQACTPAAAQAALRAIAFANQGRDPGAATRRVAISVHDGVAGTSALAYATIAVTPVDDPPEPVPLHLATVLGQERTVVLAASDPDSAALTWAVVAPPANAQVAFTDPAAGRLRLVPTASGTGAMTVSVSDGVNDPVPLAIPVLVTGPDDARPQVAGSPPHDAYEGEEVDATIPWDVRDLPAGAQLDFAAVGEAPEDLVLTAVSATAVRLRFTARAPALGGHQRFGVLAVERTGAAAGLLPVCLLVRPRPQERR